VTIWEIVERGNKIAHRLQKTASGGVK